MLEVTAGDQRVPLALYQFHCIAAQSPDAEDHLDACLHWLIVNRLVGARFAEWLENEQEGSPLKGLTWVIMRVKRNQKPEPVYAGR